jgi:hypothetical protein
MLDVVTTMLDVVTTMLDVVTTTKFKRAKVYIVFQVIHIKLECASGVSEATSRCQPHKVFFMVHSALSMNMSLARSGYAPCATSNVSPK